MTEEKTKSIDEFYNNLYRNKKSLAMRPEKAYESFIKMLQPLEEGTNFLDIGCGTGMFLKLAARYKLKTYGVDISSEAISLTKLNSPSSVIKLSSAESLPWPDDFFDYVSCLGSLEHFVNIPHSLAEMKRVSKAKAKFLFVMPNKNYFFWRFKNRPGTHQRDIGEELKTLTEWRDLLGQAGFKILKIDVDLWPTQSLKWFYSLWPHKIIKRLAFKLIWQFLPIDKTYQFVILANKI